MNKLRLFLNFLPLVLFSCQSTGGVENDFITINIHAESEDVISASVTGYFDLWQRFVRVPKDSQNTIHIKRKVVDGELFNLVIRGVYGTSYLYLEKGDSLSISVKNEKLIIEGDSKEANQNRFLQDLDTVRAKVRRYYSYKKRLANGKQVNKPKELDVNAIYQELDEMLLQFKIKTKDYSKSFVRFVELDNKYFRIKNELNMPNYKVRTYYPFANEDLVKLEECLEDSKNSEAIFSLYYRQVLKAYIDYLRINDPENLLVDGKDWLANEVNVAKYIPNPEVRQYIVADNFYALYYYNGKRPEYIKAVSNHTGQWASFIIEQAQGVKSKSDKTKYTHVEEYPVFEGMNVNGKRVNLDDFKGQWVYMDIWATWSSPSNFEIPYLNELKQRLKDYNVAFVSMSVDKDEDRDKLLKMISEKNLGGIQLQNSDIPAIYSQFAVFGIPHYVIISPEGKLFLNKAPKPSTGIPDRLLKALAGKK